MKHISKNFTIHYTIRSLYIALEITSCLLYCAWATALEVGGIFFGIFGWDIWLHGCTRSRIDNIKSTPTHQSTKFKIFLLGPSMIYSSHN